MAATYGRFDGTNGQQKQRFQPSETRKREVVQVLVILVLRGVWSFLSQNL